MSRFVNSVTFLGDFFFFTILAAIPPCLQMVYDSWRCHAEISRFFEFLLDFVAGFVGLLLISMQVFQDFPDLFRIGVNRFEFYRFLPLLLCVWCRFFKIIQISKQRSRDSCDSWLILMDTLSHLFTFTGHLWSCTTSSQFLQRSCKILCSCLVILRCKDHRRHFKIR